MHDPPTANDLNTEHWCPPYFCHLKLWLAGKQTSGSGRFDGSNTNYTATTKASQTESCSRHKFYWDPLSTGITASATTRWQSRLRSWLIARLIYHQQHWCISSSRMYAWYAITMRFLSHLYPNTPCIALYGVWICLHWPWKPPETTQCRCKCHTWGVWHLYGVVRHIDQYMQYHAISMNVQPIQMSKNTTVGNSSGL